MVLRDLNDRHPSDDQGASCDAEKITLDRAPGRDVFDSGIRRAYPNRYVLSVRRRRDVLLSSDAGVWLGTLRNSSHPPGEAGGFCFHLHL